MFDSFFLAPTTKMKAMVRKFDWRKCFQYLTIITAFLIKFIVVDV